MKINRLLGLIGASVVLQLGTLGVYAETGAQPHTYPLLVKFDIAKADLKVEKTATSSFEKVATEMKNYPYAKLEIDGYADQTGPEAYNQKLSEQRAEVVRQYFIDHYGIDAARITARAFGEERPAATNATREGRSENRRVLARVFRLEPSAVGSDKPTL